MRPIRHQPRRALLVGLLSVLVATAVLTPTPASAEVRLPGFLEELFGGGTKTSEAEGDEDTGCKLVISEPMEGFGPALRGGPLVFGVVIEVGLFCWGAPAYDIALTIGITREHTIVNKVWTRRPGRTSAFWYYQGASLVMRGPVDVMPDTYWGWADADYSQNGERKSTATVISGMRWMP